MTKIEGTAKVFLLFLMLSILSSAQTPINLSSETYQVKKTSDETLNYLYYVDRSAASQNYHFISSQFDEATGTFKSSNYEVTQPNCEIEAVSQNQKCALIFDPTATSEKFQIVDFSPANTAVLKRDLLSASLTAGTVDSATKFSVANDCSAFQMDNQIYRNLTGNVFATPYAFDATSTHRVFSQNLEYAVANEGIMIYNSSTNAYELQISVTLRKNKKVFSTSNGVIVLSWSDLDVPTSSFAYELRVFNLVANPAQPITENVDAKLMGSTLINPPEIAVSKDRSVVVVYGKESTGWKVQAEKISFKVQKSYLIPVLPIVLNTESYITVSNRYIYARNIVDRATTTKKYHGLYIINGNALGTFFEEELTALTNWKRSIIGSATEGAIKLYHEIDALGVKSISISQKQHPLSTVFIAKHESKPRYIKRSFQKVNDLYSFTVVDYDANLALNHSKISWGLNHTDYLIRAISPQLKCAIVVNLEVGNEIISVVALGATQTTLMNVNSFTTISYKDAASSGIKLGVTDDCLVITKDTTVYHYQSSSGSYVQDTLPTTASDPFQVYSPDYKFMVANTGVFKYNPLTKTYDSAVTKTLKKNKKIWNTNSKLLVLTWSDPDAVTSVVSYDIFAMSVVNNTVYTQIPSSAAFVFTGSSYATPPSIQVSQDLGVFVVYGKNQIQVFFKKGFRMHFKYDTAVQLVLPPLFDTESYIAVSGQYIYARNTVNKVGTTLKYHGGYFINSKQLTAYFETVFVAPVGLQRSFVSTSTIGELTLTHELQFNNGNENVQSPQKMAYPFEKSLMTKHAAKSQYLFYSKTNAAKEWKYTVMERRPGSSQDVEESKVELTLLSSEYEVKAVSTNFKCVLLYRYQTDNEEISLVDFGTSPSAIIKTNVLGKAIGLNIGNVASLTSKFQVSDDCRIFRRDQFVYRSANGIDFLTNPADVGHASPLMTADFMYAAAGAGIVKRFNSVSYVTLVSFTGTTRRILNKQQSIMRISESTVGGKIVTLIQMGMDMSGFYQQVVPAFTFTSDLSATVSVSENLDYFVVSGFVSGVFMSEIRRVSYRYKVIKSITSTPMLTASSSLTLMGPYLYIRNSDTGVSPQHGLYKITNQGLIPYFESQLVPQITSNEKRSLLVASLSPDAVIVYNEEISQTASSFNIQITTQKFTLNFIESDSSRILEGTKDSANFLTFERNPGVKKVAYSLFSYNHGLPTSVGNENGFIKVRHNCNTFQYELLAVSENLKCAMLYQSELHNEEVILVDFSTTVTATVRAQNLLASPSSISLRSILSSPLVVTDDCKSFAVGKDTYRLSNDGVITKTNALTTSTLYSYTKDLSLVLTSSEGCKIYHAPPFYGSIGQFSAISLFENGQRTLYNRNIVIVSTKTSLPNGSGTRYTRWNHGSTYALTGSLTLNYASTFKSTFLTSPNLENFFTTGLDSFGLKQFHLRRWNFEDPTVTNYQPVTPLPALLTATQSFVYLSNKYLYGRNVQNRDGTTDKYHGLYQIKDLRLYEVFEEIIPSTTIAIPWASSYIIESDLNQVILYNEYYAKEVVNSNVEVETKFYKFSYQYKWNFETEGPLQSLYETPNELSWISSHSTSSNRSNFASLIFDPTEIYQTTNVDRPTIFQILKAVSINKKCALYFIPGTNKTVVYDLVKKTWNDTRNIINSTLLDGIDLSTAESDVGNDCFCARIGDKVLHVDTGTGVFILDSLPVSLTTLLNPGFTADFSLMVTNNAISIFVPKNSSSLSGSYILSRNDSFYSLKNVSKLGNNIVVFSQQQSSTPGKWNFKLQFNVLSGTATKKIAEFTDRTTGKSQVYISPKLTKIIVSAKSFNSEAVPFYLAKTINFKEERADDIALPFPVQSKFNSIALIDDYLFVRNLNGEIRQRGYFIAGDTLQEAFNELVGPSFLPNYARTVIMIENSKSIVLYHQFNIGKIVRITKDKRENLAEYFNPKQGIPYEMQYQSVNPLISTDIGKYVSEIQVTKPNKEFRFSYSEYDPTAGETKMKSLNFTKTSKNIEKIVAVSSTMDCMITVASMAVNVYDINSSNPNTFSSPRNVFNMVRDSIKTPIVIESITRASKNVAVMPGCKVFKFIDTYYVQDGSCSYKKSTLSTLPIATVFDPLMKFYMISDQVFKYNVADDSSVLLFTIFGLQTTTELYVSEDEQKVIILSYVYKRIVYIDQCSNIMMSVFSRKSDNSWTEIKVIQNFTYISWLRPRYSANFQIVGLFSAIKTTSPYTQVNSVAYFAKIDYSTNVALPVNLPSYYFTNQWLDDNIIQITVSDKYLYLYRIKIDKTERIFSFEPQSSTTYKVTLLYSVERAPYTITNTNRIKFAEKDGKNFILYEITPSKNVVQVYMKRIADDNSTVDLQKIRSPTAGVFLSQNSIGFCQQGCKTCWDSRHCAQCLPGFTIDLYMICYRCAPLCKACLIDDLSTCSTVIDGYYKGSDGKAQKCHESCDTCNGAGPNACVLCKVSFRLANGACIPCPQNCMSCYLYTGAVFNTTSVCDYGTCNVGYAYQFSTNLCVKCPLGCSLCNPDKVYECQNCRLQYRPVYDSSNKTIACAACPENCATCDEKTCLTCRGRFRIQGTICVPICEAPCRSCSNNTAFCLSCIEGYKLSGSSCVPDLTCNSSKTCKTCPSGYSFKQGECFLCDTGPNCKSCSLTNNKQCTSCLKGFFMSTNLSCVSCAAGCIDCIYETYCRQCSVGYTLAYQREESLCLKCEANCATCWRSPTNCLTCSNGFAKEGWNCVKKFRLNAKIELIGSLNNLTTDKYRLIEDDIVRITGRGRKQFHILRLLEGSIIVNLMVEADNQDQENVLANKLKTAIQQTPIIGGFIVISYTAVSNSFIATPDQNQNPNPDANPNPNPNPDANSNPNPNPDANPNPNPNPDANPNPNPDANLQPNPQPNSNDSNNTETNPLPLHDQDTQLLNKCKPTERDQLAIILGISIPAVLIIVFLSLFVLYLKGIIFNKRPVEVLDTANSGDGSPVGISQFCTDSSPGMVKITEMKEVDGIIEQTNMDLVKYYTNQIQNIDLGQHEANHMRKTSTKRFSSMKLFRY